MITDRKIAHYRAADLTRAIIRQDECHEECLRPSRAEDVDRAFRQLAADLGYTVDRVEAKAEDRGDSPFPRTAA